MDYAEALKQVQAKKSRENFMVFNFSYNLKLILPHKEAIVLLSALAEAEVLHEPYKEPHRIEELEREKIRITTMSRTEYEQYKVATLLGVSLEAVKEAASPKPKETT